MSDGETNAKVEEVPEEEYKEVDDQSKDFDPIQYITGLVNVCKYTFKLSEKEAGKVRKGRQNMVLTLLLNFEKGIKDTTFTDYEKNILKMFLKNRKQILADDENWLLDNDIKLELPNDNAKSKKDKKVIYLSTVYRKAVEMFDKHKNDPVVDGKYSEFVLLPSRIFRYLYLLFMEFSDDGDEDDILSDYIDKIETQLQITDRTYMEDFSMGGLFGGNIQDGLKKIFKIVLGTAKSSGMISEGAEGGLDIDKIVDTMSKLFTDKNAMGNLSKEIGECKGDKKAIMQILVRQIDKPELLEVIRSATGMEMDSEKLRALVEKSDVGGQIEQVIDKVLPKILGSNDDD